MNDLYFYKAVITHIVDGDTIDVDIDLGFDVILKNQRIRLMGVDTPECRTSDLVEKKFGLLAKSVVESFCPVGLEIYLKSEEYNRGKFGRILGTILIPQDNNLFNLNEYLIENHYAVAYEGQSKELVEAAHLANFKFLRENGKI